MILKIQKTSPKVPTPAYESIGASGFDLTAQIERSVTIPPGGHYDIPTGLMFEIPDGYELQVRPRSGLAFKFAVCTSLGTIDSDYRGEVKINLMNHGRFDFNVMPGMRIAQAVLAPVVRAKFEEVTELSKTERNIKGFGSTGI